MSATYHAHGISFTPPRPRLLTQWIRATAAKEQLKLRQLNYIFCSDETLLALNRRYLQHDTLTDVLTFDYTDTPGKIEGDVYISVERVAENAATFATPFKQELCRVMVHGLLHLAGYSDTTPELKEKMSAKEDYYLRAPALAPLFPTHGVDRHPRPPLRP